MSRVLDYIVAQPWAITSEGLAVICAIAAREEVRAQDVEAIGREPGRPLSAGSQVQIRDGVAVIPVTGPLVRYGNVFSRISGATSLESLSTDIGEALRDPQVRALVLNVDSPGGQVNGTGELARLVRAARAEKPIHTLFSGLGASGAYWIGTAASKVWAVETAIVGSIGTVMGVDPESREDAFLFVSSQSPKKRIDPATREGAANVQALVDSLAAVFVAQVAENLGITAEKVLSDFGQGGVMVGEEAHAAGMVHGITTLEDLISDLSGRASRPGTSAAASAGRRIPRPGGIMPETQPAADNQRPEITRAYLDAHHPELVAAIKAEGRTEGVTAGATAERERIAGIEALAAPGTEPLIAAAKADPTATKESTAVKIIEAQKAQGGQRLAAIAGDAAVMTPPGPGANAGVEAAKTPAEKAAFILGAGRPKQKAAATN